MIFFFLCCKLLFQQAAAVWRYKKTNKDREQRKQREGMKVFPLTVCVKPVSDMLFVKPFSPFRNRPRVCKGAGEMSQSDTVVPTRFAVWNFTTDSGYWQGRPDKISPD